MNPVQQIIKENSWIKDVTGNAGYRSALFALARLTIPSRFLKEMKQTAKENNTTYAEVLAINLSFELAIVALMVKKVPNLPEILSILGGAAKEAQPIGCTTVGVFKDNTVQFWRNLDWPDPGSHLANNTSIRQTYMFTDVIFPGQTGVLTARRKGKTPYAVAINAVFVDGDNVTLGASPTMLLREVMETCPTFDEAVEKLSKKALICPVVFTVVSAKGEMVAIERSPLHYAHRYPDQPKNSNTRMIVTTNDVRVMDPGDAGSSLGELADTADSRYENVKTNYLEWDMPMKDVMIDAEFGCTIYTAHTDFTHPHSGISISKGIV
jgi:hypothetical protein